LYLQSSSGAEGKKKGEQSEGTAPKSNPVTSTIIKHLQEKANKITPHRKLFGKKGKALRSPTCSKKERKW